GQGGKKNKLSVVCCLLPVACCLLPIAYCLFPVPCSLFPNDEFLIIPKEHKMKKGCLLDFRLRL
ncbi:MAG TPA: hypothetical protein VK184_20730, partial [Nostocaceae cyanobacterium]|nr:hypothetical protein [Nostocaceae cyanobacterium]